MAHYVLSQPCNTYLIPFCLSVYLSVPVRRPVELTLQGKLSRCFQEMLKVFLQLIFFQALFAPYVCPKIVDQMEYSL